MTPAYTWASRVAFPSNLCCKPSRAPPPIYQRAAQHPAALRNQVTSPGGTSAEALYYLEKAGFRSAISRAIWAAYQRSLELGKEKPVHIPGSQPEESEA